MISRFFSNAMPRRFLCLLLALLTCFCALSPALVQPAEAVAVADDVLIASLCLLAVSWAGITFTTNAGANTAISNLLESRPVVKASLAGLITKNLVLDGAKLLLTSDVRDVFKTVLPEIKGFFHTSEDGSGSLCGPVAVGSFFPITVMSSDLTSDQTSYFKNNGQDQISLPLKSKWILVNDGVTYTGVVGTGNTFVMKSEDGTSRIDFPRSFYGLFFDSDKGCIWIPYVTGMLFTKYIYGSVSFSPVSGDVPFHQSQEVDGTSALEILKPAPLYVVDPSGGDDKDPTEGTKPEINFKYAMIALEGLIGALTLSGSDAEKDPGIKPDEMIEQLKKAMESYNTDPDPNPDPAPDPEPDPDPTEEPDSGDSSDSFDYNKFKLPELFTIFPFCIPFDLLAFMKVLSADPVAPSFTFATSFLGQLYTVNVDLSAWNGVASTLRYMVVAIYVVSLAVATRKFIKW